MKSHYIIINTCVDDKTSHFLFFYMGGARPQALPWKGGSRPHALLCLRHYADCVDHGPMLIYFYAY